MSIWLLTALVSLAAWAILGGTFLAGSRHRISLTWGAVIGGMGVLTLALIFISSLDTSLDPSWSLFDFNPLRLAKRVWKTSDYTPVILGVLAGTAIPVAGVIGVLAILRQHIQKPVETLAIFTGYRWLDCFWARYWFPVEQRYLSRTYLRP